MDFRSLICAGFAACLSLSAGMYAQQDEFSPKIDAAMLLVGPGPDPHNHLGTGIHGKPALEDSLRRQHRLPEINELLRTATASDDHRHDGPNAVQLVQHRGYRSAMHRNYHVPLWVSHALTRRQLQHPLKAASRAGRGYPADPAYPLLKSNLYRSSGYDHGHLAPARDFKHDTALYRECFYMTNMSPQHGCMNQKGWCHLEDLTRMWARDNDSTVTYVVSGALLHHNTQYLFADTLCIGPSLTICVPRYYYKAVCVYNAAAGKAKAIAFAVPNAEVSYSSLQQLALSIDELEDLLGLDLFPALPEAIAQQAERSAGHFPFDPVGEFECRDKPCGTVYRKRETPVARKKLRCR